jgi:hypothetical protein
MDCWRGYCKGNIKIQAIKVGCKVKSITIDKKGKFIGVGGDGKSETFGELCGILNAAKFTRLCTPK